MANIINRKFKSSLFLLSLSILPFSQGAEAEPLVSLRDQLQTASEKFGITIIGLEKTREEPALPESAQSAADIRRLLARYNHLLVESDDGGIEKVIILDRLAPRPDRILLRTEKQGGQHTIPISIIGNRLKTVEVRLMVDTGADYVVLPESMIETLGMDGDSMNVGKMQTANGVALAKIGVLSAMRIGHELVSDVDVAFVADELLGDAKLLGMRVLSRYRMTLDDDLGQITLIRK